MAADIPGALLGVAKLGLGKDFVGMLLEMANPEITTEQLRFMVGPLVVHKTDWANERPKWMDELVSYDRLRTIQQQLAGEIRSDVCGPIELACVMYGATFIAPLPSELADIYLWATGHACREDGRSVPEALVDATPTDAQIYSEKGRYFNDWHSLASQVRRQVVKHAPKDVKAGNYKQALRESVETPKPIVTLEIEQLSIFETT